MDNQPATVGLLTEDDGLYLMDRFFARVGSLTTVDVVRQDGCLPQHLEFHDARIDRQRNRQGVLLCRPSAPLITVLVQGTEAPPSINHRRLLGEARKLVIPAPFAKGGHESLNASRTSLPTAWPSILRLTRFYGCKRAALPIEYSPSATPISLFPTRRQRGHGALVAMFPGSHRPSVSASLSGR